MFANLNNDWSEFLWDNGYDIGERYLCHNSAHTAVGCFIYEIVHDEKGLVGYIPCQGRSVGQSELFELAVKALTDPQE